LVQLTRSKAFCQSMKQAHNSSSMTKVRSDIILILVLLLACKYYRSQVVFSITWIPHNRSLPEYV
jgi:hypothetical protein